MYLLEIIYRTLLETAFHCRGKHFNGKLCLGFRLAIIGFEPSCDIMSAYNDYLSFWGMHTGWVEHRKYGSVESREAER